jgi:nitrite reductase/ring-hydroxylating ferredoxin subunit
MSEHGKFNRGWWVVEEARKIGTRPRTLTRLGKKIVLWRDGGALRAHAAQCPHRGVDLGAGRVLRGELECPYHGFRFDGSGRCVGMPCEGAAKKPPERMRLRAYPVREERGLAWIYFGEERDALPPLPWPEAMPAIDRGSCTRHMIWSVPHSRAMEAMLDIHHAPHAHRLLSPGIGARLDPLQVRCEDGALHIDGWLRDDTPEWDGKRGAHFVYEARPPGILHLSFGKWISGLVASTPIDDAHTFILMRFFVPIPVVGSLIAWAALKLEIGLVQPDDERMQRLTLRDAGDLSECTLVRADAPIVEWQRLVAAREKRREAH